MAYLALLLYLLCRCFVGKGTSIQRLFIALLSLVPGEVRFADDDVVALTQGNFIL